MTLINLNNNNNNNNTNNDNNNNNNNNDNNYTDYQHFLISKVRNPDSSLLNMSLSDEDNAFLSQYCTENDLHVLFFNRNDLLRYRQRNHY